MYLGYKTKTENKKSETHWDTQPQVCTENDSVLSLDDKLKSSHIRRKLTL